MKKDNKKVVYWLLTGCILIFIMVVVGGITRLTHSGLSISNYKLISGLSNEVKRYTTEFIDKKRAFGELGHPDGPTVNLERVSHMITSLKSEGKNFIGEAKIMDTPYGKIVKGLIDEGAQLGVSSRGMGSLVQKNGSNYVGKDFYLATAADIVADPSAPDAFVEGIMENKEWIWDNGEIKAKDIEEYKRYIEKAKSIQLAEAKANVFANFLEKL